MSGSKCSMDDASGGGPSNRRRLVALGAISLFGSGVSREAGASSRGVASRAHSPPLGYQDEVARLRAALEAAEVALRAAEDESRDARVLLMAADGRVAGGCSIVFCLLFLRKARFQPLHNALYLLRGLFRYGNGAPDSL